MAPPVPPRARALARFRHGRQQVVRPWFGALGEVAPASAARGVRQVPKGRDGWDEVSQEDAERLIARLIIEDVDRRGRKWEHRTRNGADDGADVMVFDPASCTSSDQAAQEATAWQGAAPARTGFPHAGARAQAGPLDAGHSDRPDRR